jgi:hypothetical protein
VQFSGGIGSFAAALRVAATHGTDDLVLLTADTQVEDPDLWRFAAQAAEYIGGAADRRGGRVDPVRGLRRPAVPR